MEHNTQSCAVCFVVCAGTHLLLFHLSIRLLIYLRVREVAMSVLQKDGSLADGNETCLENTVFMTCVIIKR